MMDDAVNPVNPTSVGALLTEELTMSPFTPLPSFLEMMMIEETAFSGRRALSSTLQAAVDRAAAVAALPLDDASIWIKLRTRLARLLEYAGRNFSPEIRLLVAYLLEAQCIKSSACATLSESMFGARRAKLGKTELNSEGKSYRKVLPLSDRDKTRLALLVSLAPYAKERLDKLYERFHRERTRQTGRLDRWNRFCSKVRASFVILYPFLHMTHEGTMLAYEWSYLLGRSLFFSPSSHLLGLIVRRATIADISNNKTSNPASRALSPEEKLREFILRRLRLAALIAVSSGLVIGWISQLRNEMRRRRRQHLLEGESHQQEQSFAVPPPQSPPLHMDELDRIRPLPEDLTLCPLCRQPRINPAASTSSHVFCYRCLLLYVREHGTCPLTGRDCPEFRILRIYEPQNVSPST